MLKINNVKIINVENYHCGKLPMLKITNVNITNVKITNVENRKVKVPQCKSYLIDVGCDNASPPIRGYIGIYEGKRIGFGFI